VPIVIPEKRRTPLYKLGGYSTELIDRIVTALSQVSVSQDPNLVAKAIEPQLPDLNPGELRSLIGMIFSLQFAKPEGVELGKFEGEVIDSLLIDATDEDAERARAIRGRLLRLLGVESLARTLKAYDLQTEHERTFLRSRIVSDVRPVFGEDTSKLPVSAVINHTLKIEFHEADSHKEFFVVLDPNDITELAKVLERAKIKEQSIRQMLASENLPLIELK